MSARQAGFTSEAPPPRSARAALVVLAAVLGLAACASHERATKKKDDASTYNTQLGIAYLRQGDVPLAKEKLDRALRENPGNPEVHSARAMLFDRMGEPAKADAEYRAALRLAPQDPDVSNNYAVYLCQIGRTDEGVHRFEAVARNALYRTPWVAYSNAGVCLRSAKRNAEAARNFKQALLTRPNFAEAAYQLGDLEFQGGNLTDARAQVDTYIGAFEATPDLLLLGVRVARAQGDRLAVEHYARKLRLDFPSSAQTHALAELDHN
ncbi:MAG: type IV pilus biogenesis/stability protein PilW, partial [Steroidobacteraceae bacterium]